ncbi:MAG: 4-(cytidine 5'-diphospho)-2-C-methyl-D-erythritol kinase [Gemmatimonadaceae bacterium]
MTTRVAVRAQAKLNLWLHVMAREESGYHTIETLFHRIELADDVTVTLAAPGARTIECSEDVGPAHENLAYRAAQMYCGPIEWLTGFHIEITKRIPAGGGLGGGSADAAATLLALNAMSPRPMNEAALADLGRQLGADVPYLLTNAPKALAWWHGDRMLKLPPLPQKHVVLIIPDFRIGTPEVFQSLWHEAFHHPGQLSVDDLTNWRRIAQLARNDLSRSLVIRRHTQLADSIMALRAAGAEMAEMTGSGSVVFGIFDSEPNGEALERATGCRVVLTRTALNVEGPRRLD